VTDPPYEYGFMSKSWDRSGIAFRPETWQAALRVVKPGGYMLACGGTRTWHRLACAIEDAGWEIRDTICYLYGVGFPKGKGCLKPAWEPVLLCRKPGPKVLPLGIDECRVPGNVDAGWCKTTGSGPKFNGIFNNGEPYPQQQDRFHASPSGRYPANVVHDGSDEVQEAFAAFGESKARPERVGLRGGRAIFGQKGIGSPEKEGRWPGDTGGTPARFFYCAKASKRERGQGNSHPCVKPLALLSWLVKLICPPGGVVLDPFMGSASTGVACLQNGRKFIGMELDEGYFKIAQRRIREAEAAREAVPV
jgi:hypothetical protein